MSPILMTVSSVSQGLFMPWKGPSVVTVHLTLWQLHILFLIFGLAIVGLWHILCAALLSLMRSLVQRPCLKDAARSDKMTLKPRTPRASTYPSEGSCP